MIPLLIRAALRVSSVAPLPAAGNGTSPKREPGPQPLPSLALRASMDRGVGRCRVVGSGGTGQGPSGPTQPQAPSPESQQPSPPEKKAEPSAPTPPAPPMDRQEALREAAELVHKLDSDEFYVRQQAADRLRELAARPEVSEVLAAEFNRIFDLDRGIVRGSQATSPVAAESSQGAVAAGRRGVAR